ncbi:DUF1405 domain-containing protein [Desulforudis sp. 1088]|uniref:DUF1405 domain-containing protein n=3 Tax=Candidatus Desulforudis TaxID=471826 RepID=UPI003CE5117E
MSASTGNAGPYRGLLGYLLVRRRLLLALLLINAAATVYGFFWYREQLAATPWYYWPFTPECPIQSLLFALVLGLRLSGRPWAFLEAFTMLGLIKYGAWTVGIIGHHWFTGGQWDFEKVFLFVAHVGMAYQGIVFLPLLVPARYLVFLVGPWFGFMDFLDYGAGIHPYLPGGDRQLPQAVTLAVLTTVLTSLYTLPWLRANPRDHSGNTS